MAANMKAVKLRIKSVQNTMQITQAMQLVASSKLRKAKERADRCKPYEQELLQTLKDIAGGYVGFQSIYAKASSNEKYCYILVAGDRGMAGGYNSNVFKCLEARKGSDAEIVVLPVGKRAVDYASRRGYEILTTDFAQVEFIDVGDCFRIAELLCSEFRKGRFGHIEMCHTEFVSMLTQKPTIFPILPLHDIAKENKDPEAVKKIGLTLYDPNPEEVFDVIVPEYLAGLIYAGICSSLASELAARRTAMDAATKNAGEMIDKLSLYYNRARQASITQEITEIVAGAEGV